MTQPDAVAPEPKDDVSPASWGTWEELLLAFAVNRYGTAAWDSVASELQKRTSDPNVSVTAHNCRLRYIDLKRRFVAPTNGDLYDDDDEDGRDVKSAAEETAPLLEELRKLRVAELRREVQRYDLNIESLELKKKRMEEEREKSLKREKSVSDLEKDEDKIDVEPETEPATDGEPVTVEESDKDQSSVNESNSTDPGAEKSRTGEKESEPARTVGAEVRQDQTGQTSEEPTDLKSEPDHKSVREDSCNGSSNSIDEPDRKTKIEPVTDSVDLVESEAESDGGGEEATKENSDVQSSASRSRKEEGSDKMRRGKTTGDEREHEDQSRAVKELPAESQPLLDFLRAIRGHKLGSVFERRLRSQETSKYQKLILQHIDLETIETRLKQGCYSSSSSSSSSTSSGKFFRDLLLLVNNALVFYAKNSAESNAATEIRHLISKEISQKRTKSDSSSGKQISLQSLSKKEEAEPSHSLLLKPRISGSLIVCRKRSSIAAKGSGSSSGAEKKKEQQTLLLADEKKDNNTKAQHSQLSGDNTDEPKITKKRTRDRFSSASANSKKNGKTPANNNKSSATEKQQGKGGGGSSSQQVEPKSETKKSQSTLDSKKRGAANFLNRMKQGSSSNNGVLLDALKNTPLTSESTTTGKGGSDSKKSESAKRGEKKEPVTRRSAETRQAKEKEKEKEKEREREREKEKEKEKEKGSPGKRNVGRPPKRGAAPPPALGKRGRERGGDAETSASKQPKKRTRKL